MKIYWKGEHIKINTRKREYALCFIKEFGMPVSLMSEELGVPVEKIREDIKNKYLRVIQFSTPGMFDEEIILKDYCYLNYMKHNGDTTKLKPCDFSNRKRFKYFINNYQISSGRIGHKRYVTLLSPYGTMKKFIHENHNEARLQAIKYAVENDGFGIDSTHFIPIQFSQHELYYLLSLMPPNKAIMLKKKLSFYIELLKIRLSKSSNNTKGNNEHKTI